MEALNGFAVPPPVSCGLRPTPSLDVVPVGEIAPPVEPNVLVDVGEVVDPLAPVVRLPPKFGCCLFNAPNSEATNEDELSPAPAPGAMVLAPGVVVIKLEAFDELGIGGNESIKAAPKDEVGLNGLSPAKPVT
jgi:hypothetical protein